MKQEILKCHQRLIACGGERYQRHINTMKLNWASFNFSTRQDFKHIAASLFFDALSAIITSRPQKT